MKYAGLALGVFVLALVVYVVTGKSASLDAELAKLAPGDRQAVEALLAEAGLAATKLRLVELRALKYNGKAVAVENGRLVGLRLSQVPLSRADAVVGLTGLKELWLSENGLATLPSLAPLVALQRLDLSHNKLREASGLAGLPALQRLVLSHNALASAAGLRELPALTELDLSDNQLTDVTPLTALPALVELDVRYNPLNALPSPLPARWNVKSDALRPPAESVKPPADRPPNWVADTPRLDGQAQDVTIEGLVQSRAYKVEGRVRRLRGAFTPWNLRGDDNSHGANTTLELTVETGRVRAYLQYIPPSDKLVKVADGYIFAEAEPGKPGRITGLLKPTAGGVDTPITYQLAIESRDGEAQGITFRLSR